IAYSQTALANGDFVVGSAPLYQALFAAVYRNRDYPRFNDAADGFRKSISGILTKHSIATLTNVEYTPSGIDAVTHDIQMPDEQGDMSKIAGGAYWLEDTYPCVCIALFGTDNVEQFNDACKWISGRDAYLKRMKRSPAKRFDARVTIGSIEGLISKAFMLNATVPFGTDMPALGIRKRKIAP
ncbi:hypothetical protein HY642_03770, partial [Candidatus Woesearchaeota archaeon]|nr:hypothetical protein [Candidatus Woesearchaeota archaeon]